MRRDDYRATIIIILGYAAANLTGFFRQMVLANQLGVGREADIFLVAFALPEFVFLALPIVLYPAFIPLFTESRHHFGQPAAWRFLGKTAIGLLSLLLIFSSVVGLIAPLLIKWLSPGFDLTGWEAAVQAARIMLPSLSLMGLATLSSAALQVYGKFTPTALMTAIYNLTFSISLLILPVALLTQRASWAVNFGAGAAFVFQFVAIANYLLKSDLPPLNWNAIRLEERSSIGLTQAARLAGPLAAGYAVHHLILFIDRAMATTLETGSVAALSYANHLALVIAQLSGLAVSTVLFPRLADQISRSDLDGMRTSLADALRLVWLIALPASISLIILRDPVISLLFERGAFDKQATMMVSPLLVWYGLSVLADAVCQPFWRVIYAQKSAWTVFRVNGLQTLIRILGNIVLIRILGYVGLAVSAMLGLMLQAFVLGLLVNRRLGAFWTASWWQSIRQIVVATALAAFVTGIMSYNLHLQPILQLLVCGGIGGVVYLIVVLQFPRLKERKLWY